jgi:hypothetical protein
MRGAKAAVAEVDGVALEDDVGAAVGVFGFDSPSLYELRFWEAASKGAGVLLTVGPPPVVRSGGDDGAGLSLCAVETEDGSLPMLLMDR